MKTFLPYDALAGLLAYPGDDYHQRVTRAVDSFHLVLPPALLVPSVAEGSAVEGSAAKDLSSPTASLEHFAEHIRDFSVEALQELFIQTFDLNPDRSLEVGWHLFGENYDRGTFLVKMRQQLRRFGIVESSELPDHITHVLAVLARMPADEAEEFAVACVFPALEKIRGVGVPDGSAGRAGFGKKVPDNPFEKVLDALAALLHGQYGDALRETASAAPALRVLDSAPGRARCGPAFPEGELP